MKRCVWLAILAASAGCAGRARPSRPCNPADLSGCLISDVAFSGNRAIGAGELREKIATAETTHVAGGVFERVPLLSAWDAASVEYEVFDRFVLERDLQRIQRLYQAHGFYEARVRAARVMRLPSGKVRVEIDVVEGAPVTIERIELKWKDWRLPDAANVSAPVTDAKDKLKVGQQLDEQAYEAVKKAIVRELRERGFAYADVQGNATVDLLKHKATVTFTIELGPLCAFGDISIVGLGELPERPLRAALGMVRGDPFSVSALESAEIALSDAGVFGGIRVIPELAPAGKPRNAVIPVRIIVQPSKLRAVRLGAGGQIGSRFEVHLSVGWEDRNFLGGLRRFTIEGRPGLVFYPTRFDTLFTAPPTTLLPELDLRMELRQPAVLEARTSAILRGGLRIYRPPSSETTAQGDEELNVFGYREYTGTLGLERRFIDYQHYLGQFVHVKFDDPFSYNFERPPPGYERVLIPYTETIAALDFRRGQDGKIDRINPHSGFFAGAEAQLAVLGDAFDIRLRPDLRAYVPISRSVTLGMRLVMGFLFPQNYGHFLDPTLPSPVTESEQNVTTEGEKQALRDARDTQLLQLRGFFSGGANSNRGYIFKGVGPHDFVKFLSQNQSTDQKVPIGGLTLLEASLELRFPLADKLGAVIFADASDVTRGMGELRLTHPHLSVGFGLRYATPVGPFRVDVGYRVPCAQTIETCDNVRPDEGEPGTVLGLPIAVSVAFGEAF